MPEPEFYAEDTTAMNMEEGGPEDWDRQTAEAEKLQASMLKRAYDKIKGLAREYGLFNAGGEAEKKADEIGVPMRGKGGSIEPGLVMSTQNLPGFARATLKVLFGKSIFIVMIDVPKLEYHEELVKLIMLHELVHIQKIEETTPHSDAFYARFVKVLRAAMKRGIISKEVLFDPILEGMADVEGVWLNQLRDELFPETIVKRRQTGVFSRVWLKIPRPVMPVGKMSPYAPNVHK